LALRVLRRRFPGVRVESFYEVAGSLVDRGVEVDPLLREVLWGAGARARVVHLCAERLAAAWLLIRGSRRAGEVEEPVEEFLREAVGYLERVGGSWEDVRSHVAVHHSARSPRRVEA